MQPARLLLAFCIHIVSFQYEQHLRGHSRNQANCVYKKRRRLVYPLSFVTLTHRRLLRGWRWVCFRVGEWSESGERLWTGLIPSWEQHGDDVMCKPPEQKKRCWALTELRDLKSQVLTVYWRIQKKHEAMTIDRVLFCFVLRKIFYKPNRQYSHLCE